MFIIKRVKFNPSQNQELTDSNFNYRAYHIVPLDTSVVVTLDFKNNPHSMPWRQTMPLSEVLAEGLHSMDAGTVVVRMELADPVAFENLHGVKIDPASSKAVYQFDYQWIVVVLMPFDM